MRRKFIDDMKIKNTADINALSFNQEELKVSMKEILGKAIIDTMRDYFNNSKEMNSIDFISEDAEVSNLTINGIKSQLRYQTEESLNILKNIFDENAILKLKETAYEALPEEIKNIQLIENCKFDLTFPTPRKHNRIAIKFLLEIKKIPTFQYTFEFKKGNINALSSATQTLIQESWVAYFIECCFGSKQPSLNHIKGTTDYNETNAIESVFTKEKTSIEGLDRSVWVATEIYKAVKNIIGSFLDRKDNGFKNLKFAVTWDLLKNTNENKNKIKNMLVPAEEQDSLTEFSQFLSKIESLVKDKDTWNPADIILFFKGYDNDWSEQLSEEIGAVFSSSKDDSDKAVSSKSTEIKKMTFKELTSAKTTFTIKQANEVLNILTKYKKILMMSLKQVQHADYAKIIEFNRDSLTDANAVSSKNYFSKSLVVKLQKPNEDAASIYLSLNTEDSQKYIQFRLNKDALRVVLGTRYADEEDLNVKLTEFDLSNDNRYKRELAYDGAITSMLRNSQYWRSSYGNDSDDNQSNINRTSVTKDHIAFLTDIIQSSFNSDLSNRITKKEVIGSVLDFSKKVIFDKKEYPPCLLPCYGLLKFFESMFEFLKITADKNTTDVQFYNYIICEGHHENNEFSSNNYPYYVKFFDPNAKISSLNESVLTSTYLNLFEEIIKKDTVLVSKWLSEAALDKSVLS